MWTVLRQAHEGVRDNATNAQRLLIERYRGAVYRYLMAAVRDTELADELLQEFALSLIRREFRGTDSSRGRFRDYIKSVLFHLVGKHRKKYAKERQRQTSEPIADVAADPEMTEQFDDCWRDELLARTWTALQDVNRNYFVTLQTRAAYPDDSSTKLARRIGERLGKPVSAEAARQNLSRARDTFAELLVNEVAQSLKNPSTETLHDELSDLGLLEYCRPVLQRVGRG